MYCFFFFFGLICLKSVLQAYDLPLWGRVDGCIILWHTQNTRPSWEIVGMIGGAVTLKREADVLGKSRNRSQATNKEGGVFYRSE